MNGDQVNDIPKDKPEPDSSSALPEKKGDEIVVPQPETSPTVQEAAADVSETPVVNGDSLEAVVEPVTVAGAEEVKAQILQGLVHQQVLETSPAAVVESKKRVILIDDKQDIIDITSRILRSKFDTHGFTDPTEGLNECLAHPPDLIVLDILMPGINGVELIKRLQEGFKDKDRMPGIIVMTASDLSVDQMGFLEEHEIPLITKPFSPRELTGRIEAEIRRAQGHTYTALDLLNDDDFLRCSSLDVVGLDIALSDPYEQLAHACNHLMTDTTTFLQNFDRFGNPVHKQKAAESFDYLKRILLELSPSDLRRFNVFKYEPRMGGSSISEKGVRLFVKRSESGYWFIRNVYSRKGVSHFVIDDIRAQTSQSFSNDRHRGKFNVPYRLPSPQRDVNCTWSIEEAIMGPNLGYVFEKIKAEMGHDQRVKRNRVLQALRDELINKCIDDLKYWQENAPQINHSSVTRDHTLIAQYFKDHVAGIIQILGQKSGVNFSADEINLWQLCSDLFNNVSLDLNRSTVVRSLDATPMNVILKLREQEDRVEKLNPSIDDIINALTDNDENVSKKEISQRLYHVDHGFVYSHYLEDFFHLADSFELINVSESAEDRVRKNISRFKGFIVRGKNNISYNKGAFFLMGFYRNIRKVFLTVSEYHEKNLEFRGTGEISDATFRINKRIYEEAIKHHAGMAQAYIEAAISRYQDIQKHFIRQNSRFISGQYIALYTRLESLIDDSSSDLDMICNNVIDIEKSLSSVEKQFYSRKYLTNAMYMAMSAILSRLTNRFQYIKLPSEIATGDQ